jgi:hypothetical protein
MSERRPGEQEQAESCDVVERRAWVRYGTDLQATCRGSGPLREAGWPARVQDVSAGGIGLLLRHRFRPGTVLAVELHGASGGCVRVLTVRVVHAAPRTVDSESCWQMGCMLAEPLAEDDLRALLAEGSR